MHTINPREKRLIQFAAIGIAIYLALFFGWSGFAKLRARRAQYIKLVAEAKGLKAEIAPYISKAATTSKLMETFRFDPAGLNRASVVADVSLALQKASAGGVQLGAIREIPNRGSGKEIATIQFEASGPLQPLLNLLGGIDTLGFPLLVDNVQLANDAQHPGQLKLSLTVIVLDYEKWKAAEVPHA